MSEFVELTEEERAAELARIHAIAGSPVGPQTREMFPPIPGPPTPEIAAEKQKLRVNTARDILQNLNGDETPEFLTKLNKIAGFPAENAGQPANPSSGFTPRTTVTNGFDLPKRGGGVPTMADVERAAGMLHEDGPPTAATSGGGIGGFTEDLARNAGELFAPAGEFLGGIRDRVLPPGGGGIGEFGSDLLRASGGIVSGDNPVDRFIGKHLLPETYAELQEAGREIGVQAEGFGDADATGRGTRISGVANEGIEAGFQVGSGVIHDLARPIEPLLRGIGGFLGDQLGMGGPQTAQAERVEEEDPDPTGNQESEPQGEDNAADAGERAAQDEAVLDQPRGGSKLEAPVSASHVSDQSGVESAQHTTTFEETPTGIHINNREIPGPPIAGTEIIRGLDRTFQAFDETGRIPQGGGEVPFGDDPLERLDNSGFTRDQAIDAVGAQAQQTLANNNALQATTIMNDAGQQVQAYTYMNNNGQIETVETDNLVPLGSNLLESYQEDPFTDALGNTTKLRRPVYFEPQQGPDGDTILVPVRVDTSADQAKTQTDNPIEWAAAIDAASDQGLQGAERINAARQLLQEFIDESQ